MLRSNNSEAELTQQQINQSAGKKSRKKKKRNKKTTKPASQAVQTTIENKSKELDEFISAILSSQETKSDGWRFDQYRKLKSILDRSDLETIKKHESIIANMFLAIGSVIYETSTEQDRINELNQVKEYLQLSINYGCMSAVYWQVKLLNEQAHNATNKEKQKILSEVTKLLLTLSKVIKDNDDIVYGLQKLCLQELFCFYELIIKHADELLSSRLKKLEDIDELEYFAYRLVAFVADGGIAESVELAIIACLAKEKFLSQCEQLNDNKFKRTETLFSAFLLGSNEALEVLIKLYSKYSDHNGKSLSNNFKKLKKNIESGAMYDDDSLSIMSNIFDTIYLLFMKKENRLDSEFHFTIMKLRLKLAISLTRQPFNQGNKKINSTRKSSQIFGDILANPLSMSLHNKVHDLKKQVDQIIERYEKTHPEKSKIHEPKKPLKPKKGKNALRKEKNKSATAVVAEESQATNLEELPPLVDDTDENEVELENNDTVEKSPLDTDVKSSPNPISVANRNRNRKKKSKSSKNRLRNRKHNKIYNQNKRPHKFDQTPFEIEESSKSILEIKKLKKMVDHLKVEIRTELNSKSDLVEKEKEDSETQYQSPKNEEYSDLSLNLLPTVKFTEYKDEDVQESLVEVNADTAEITHAQKDSLVFNTELSSMIPSTDISRVGIINIPDAASIILKHLPNSLLIGSQVTERLRLQLYGINPDLIMKKSDIDIVTGLDNPLDEIQYIIISGYTFVRVNHGEKRDSRLFKCKELNAEIYFSEQLKNSLNADAAARDFTINALYADNNGVVYDPLKRGYQDLKINSIRPIENYPNELKNFIDDPIRLLRATHKRLNGYNFEYQRSFLQPAIDSLYELKNINEDQIHYRLNRHFMEGKAELSLLILMRYGIYQTLFKQISWQHFPWLRNEMIKIDCFYKNNLEKYNHPGISRGSIYTSFIIARIRTDIDRGLHADAINEFYLENIMIEFRYPKQLRDIISGRICLDEEKRFKYFKTIIYEASAYAEHVKQQSQFFSSHYSVIFFQQPVQDIPVKTPSPSSNTFNSQNYRPHYFQSAAVNEDKPGMSKQTRLGQNKSA